MKRGYAGDIVPLLPAMLAGATVDPGEGSAQPAEPYHTPVDPISHPHPNHLFHHHLIHHYYINHHLIHHLIHHFNHHLITHHLGPMKHLSLKFGVRVKGHQANTRECYAYIGKEGEISRNSFEDKIQEVSLVRESMKEKSTDFVTPTKASGEAQKEDISPTM
ncbi:hypothetical protein Tco_0124144 [Tanacetum coccineum]